MPICLSLSNFSFWFWLVFCSSRDEKFECLRCHFRDFDLDFVHAGADLENQIRIGVGGPNSSICVTLFDFVAVCLFKFNCVYLWMGVVSRRVLPACGTLCYLCPSLRARSRQPVKRYKKLLADIFPRSQVKSQSWLLLLSFTFPCSKNDTFWNGKELQLRPFLIFGWEFEPFPHLKRIIHLIL